MKAVDFKSVLDGTTNSERQERLDRDFGEGNDIISIVGIASTGGGEVAIARMITPAEILPFGDTIDVKKDDHNILFLSSGILLMGTVWDEGAERFSEVGGASGHFLFEAITPTKMLRALVRIDGKVISRGTIPIEKEEYEKHLAGFYFGSLHDKGLN